MRAIILAGGFATRLYPLTLTRAKPLLTVAGMPVVEHIMRRVFGLAEQGLTGIIVVSNEKFADDFTRVLAGPYPVDVEVVNNGVMNLEEKLGAIGDMALGARHVPPGEDFFVLAGDNLFDFDLVPVWQAFEARGRTPMLLTRTRPRKEDTVKYNNVRLDEEGRLLEFVEKPEVPFTRRFATCVYLFPHRVVELLARYLGEGRDPDKAGYFIGWLGRQTPVYSVEPEGHWFDIGSLEEIEIADEYFTARGTG